MTTMTRLEQELEKLAVEKDRLGDIRGPPQQSYTSSTVSSSSIYNTQPKKYAPVTAPKPRRNEDGTLPPSGSRETTIKMTTMTRLEQELEKLAVEKDRLGDIRGPPQQSYTSNTVSSSSIYNTQPKKYAPVTAPKPRRNEDGTLPPSGSRGMLPPTLPKPYKGPLPPPPPAKTSHRHEQLSRSRPGGPGLSSYSPVAYSVPDDDLPPPPPPPVNYQMGSGQTDDLPPPPPLEPGYGANYAPPPPPQNAPYNEPYPRAHVGQIPRTAPEPGRPPSQTQSYAPRRTPQVPRPQEPVPPGTQKAKSTEWAYFLPQPSDQPISNPDKTGPEAKVDQLTNLLVQNMDSRPDEGEYFGLCAQCGLKVVGEDSGCTAMDRVFHVACFTCETCHTKLRGQPFYAMESKAFCENCYISSLEKCSTCSKPITERILRATGKPYHPACFTCVVCGESLDGVPFTVDATNQIHCIKDFHKLALSVCKTEHRAFPHWCALDCGLQLSSEVDGQGCYPLDDHVLCRECNAKRVQSLTSGNVH
ncbi:lipoma-preferred partner homolog [Anneissia japonica]|uniref:lipoma-preferred partner homolog n=1 Tax=Anneissia japonica TaxID=1529436 RepID=UPI0014256C8D|nr:lipoma-preferred partner homolog [Anneissia japonica]